MKLFKKLLGLARNILTFLPFPTSTLFKVVLVLGEVLVKRSDNGLDDKILKVVKDGFYFKKAKKKSKSKK